jgi:hypothetical protein
MCTGKIVVSGNITIKSLLINHKSDNHLTEWIDISELSVVIKAVKIQLSKLGKNHIIV